MCLRMLKWLQHCVIALQRECLSSQQRVCGYDFVFCRQLAADRLAQNAFKKGSTDNITVLVVDVRKQKKLAHVNGKTGD